MPQPKTWAQHGRPEVAGADVPAAAQAAGAGPGGVAGPRRGGPRRGERERGLPVLRAWPLLVVLAVQAALSLRLVRADTAFQDEATYLWAGHLQWAHWLHGMALPPFPTYFSGAPVIYPPLGALADSVGGLAGARVLSLVFMLGATALLWATAGRLFGRRAASFAAALFAVSGPVLHLGAFATYDALSVLLVGLAAWCVVRAGNRGEGTSLMIAAGAALAVANAVAYSSALFDVVVLALALLTAFPAGGRLAARRCATLLIVVVVLLTAGLLVGGRDYLTGVELTTLSRVAGASSPLAVLTSAWSWTGLIVILAIGGVIISWAGRQGWLQTLLLAVLAAAALAGPLEQARLHTIASLNKHVGLGAWFAAIAAGYAVEPVHRRRPGRPRPGPDHRRLRGRAGLPRRCGRQPGLAVLHRLAQRLQLPGHLPPPGRPRQRAPAGRRRLHRPLLSAIRPRLAAMVIHPQHRLALRRLHRRPAIRAGVTGPGNRGVYAAFITRGYFSYVALNYADTTTLDHQITADLRNSHHYRIIAVVPYGIEVPPIGKGTYIIWRYEPHP